MTCAPQCISGVTPCKRQQTYNSLKGNFIFGIKGHSRRAKLQLTNPPIRYRAVASWSRIKGMGVPLVTSLEIVTIWLCALLLAVPEILAFDVVTMVYRQRTLRTCMLRPQRLPGFLQVERRSLTPARTLSNTMKIYKVS